MGRRSTATNTVPDLLVQQVHRQATAAAVREVVGTLQEVLSAPPDRLHRRRRRRQDGQPLGQWRSDRHSRYLDGATSPHGV